MHTSIRFLREGWDVVGLDNFNDYYSIALKRKRLHEITLSASKFGRRFEMFEDDLNSMVWRRLESFTFDAIIHLAAQAGVRYSIENPRAYLESNILGFQSVLEFVSRAGIKRFIYASSSSVYGKNSSQPFSEKAACDSPESYYASTKRANELMAHSYFKTAGLKSVGLRFFTVYGPWGRPDMAPMIFTKSAFSGESIKVFNHGDQKRDFTYIDDIVEALFLSVQNFEKISKAEIFNIGYGSPTGLLDFISRIEYVTGKSLNKKFMEAQTGDVEVTFADTSKLYEFIGRKPIVTLEEGVEKFIVWYKSYFNI